MMKRLFFICMVSICLLSSKTIYAQDAGVMLGGISSNDELQIQIYPNGQYLVSMWITGAYRKQFYPNAAGQYAHLFALRIGDTVYKSSSAMPQAGSWVTTGPAVGVTHTNFTTIQDVGSPVTVGTNQEMTKMFSATHHGQPFSVTLKIIYNTTTPDYLIKVATIDATNIPAGTPISLAYGWDTYLGTSDAGYAFILPDLFGLNGTATATNMFLTTAQVQSLRLVGTRNSTSSGAIVGFFPIGRTFDRAYAANPYNYANCFNLTQWVPGSGSSSGGADTQYKFQFGSYTVAGVDNGQGVGYDNIPAGQITEIQTGLSFTARIDGELDYFWNGQKNLIANIGDSVCLDLIYTCYSTVTLTNVGFQVNHTGLQNLLGGCISTGFTGGIESCIDGNEFYQISAATVNPTSTATVSIPVNITRAGQWEIDGSAITNATQTLPFGNTATLTVPTTVSLDDSVAVVLCDTIYSHQFTVQFPDTIVAADNVTVNISYSGNTSDFLSLPASVTIPAGQSNATFTVTASSSATNGATITITLSGTDKPFATVVAPSSVQLTVENSSVTISDSLLSYWQYSTAPSLVSATGATPDAGYTLQWYLNDGVTPYADANNPINTDTAGVKNYFVSQINNTAGCESAKVPISVIIVKPQAFNYIACPGADLTLEVEAIAGVDFYWFSAQTGGVALNGSASNSYTVNNVSPPQTFWVEPRMGATVYDRIPITIDLSMSCGGTPIACALDGTLLFREDFGGNNPSDPARSSTPLPPGTTNYIFKLSGTVNDGEYGIMKSGSDANSAWHQYYDHTYPGDASRGYYMLVNADAAPGLFYTLQIDSLCAGSDLYFSTWIGNLMKIAAGYGDPDLRFILQDASTLEILAEYVTGYIPKTISSPTWQQYGFRFQAISSSVILSIYNRAPGGPTLPGNDLVLDDIEVRFCAPPITLTPSSDTAICAGSPITISGEYTDDGTFGNNLTYRWEYSLSGDINDPNAWTTLTTSTETSPLNVTYPILSMSDADTGYYRLLVGTSTSIDQPNCRAASAPVKLREEPVPVITPKTDSICSGSTFLIKPVDDGSDTVPAGTTYTWTVSTNPSISGASDQSTPQDSISQTLFNSASTSQTITYTVIPTAGTCTGSDFSITVIVENSIVTVSDSLLSYWQYSTAPSLVSATGATPASGHTLQWYLSDGTTPYTEANNPINTDTVGIKNYFVSQINSTTGCEGTKVPVSVIIVKPQAFNYAVCPASEVTMGVEAMAGVGFYWFNVQTGGSALNGSASDTYYVASAAPPQTFWVEPRMGATVYPRIPIPITLSPYCGNLTPIGCAETGTLIYKEDFRGNDPSDPLVSPIDLIGGRSDLVFNGVNPGSGNYGLVKYSTAAPTVFLYNADHTYPGDRTRGYFMYIDPAPSQMDAILYEYDITGLCSDISGMSFTVWMVDLQTASARPKAEMQILDMNTGNVITTTGTFMIPRQSPPANDPSNPAIWHQYGFNFDLPSGVSDITFRLINKEIDNVGNDWAIDDIEIRLCAPPVTITPSSDTAICAGSPITISGDYTDDGTFGNNLTYRWEHSLSGDINDPNQWTTLTTSTGTSPLNVTYPILSMSDADTGYYRLLVGTAISIDQPNCRAASAPVKLRKDPVPVITTQTATICSETAFSINPVDGGSDTVPAGTTYTWTVSANPNISGASAQTTPQDSISQTLKNLTNAIQTITYTVTPTAGICTGQSFTITVTVNPQPGITSKTDSICSGTAFSVKPVNGGSDTVPDNTTYTWTVVPNTDISGASDQPTPQDSISQTLSNLTNTSQTITYTVTPTAGICTGSPFPVTVTVIEIVFISVNITASDTDICFGDEVTFTATATGDNTLAYQWKKNGFDVGTNSPTYIDTPENDDVITCVVSSSHPCVNSSSVTSNSIKMKATFRKGNAIGIKAVPK